MEGKVINVAIIEDDPFARNWMVLVAARDWRTRIVAEIDRPDKLSSTLYDLNNEQLSVDLIVLDTDIPGGENWIPRVSNMFALLPKLPKVLCTGINANPQVLRHLNHPYFTGYILKDEIRYSFAWAISLAIEGKWVITESVQFLSSKVGFKIPQPCLVLDGRKVVSYLSERQANVARLAFLFSMERRELADELGVGDWGYGLVSEVYKAIGIEEIFTDNRLLVDQFKDQGLILSYIQKIKEEKQGKLKARDMETLAFHMITKPDIREIR